MDMHELHKYRVEKDHEARYGHLAPHEREERRPTRFGYLDQEDKQYHSPERPRPMEGEY